MTAVAFTPGAGRGPAPAPSACPLGAEPVPGRSALLRQRWSEVDEQLHDLVGDVHHELWLTMLALHRWGDTEVVIAVPSHLATWVAARYGRQLAAAVAHVAGATRTVRIEICDACCAARVGSRS